MPVQANSGIILWLNNSNPEPAPMSMQLVITINDQGHAQIQTNPPLDQPTIIGILNDMAKSVSLSTIAALKPVGIETTTPDRLNSLLNGRHG
jgi:hypothetical protein